VTYRHEPYTITLKLTISDEDKDGVWVVAEEGGQTYGDGLTPYSAVMDFLKCKAELMEELFREQDRLGKGLRQELASLVVWAEGRPSG
jgi:hypothetical protein